MEQGLSGDDRGTSESAGVAVLVLFTVIVTASVGVGVLFVDQDASGEIDAEFSYDYFDSRAAILITYESGEQLRAGDVLVAGPGPNVTWNELGPLNGSSTLEPGNRIQLNANNAYGQAIRQYHTIDLVHVAGGNRTVISQWNGASA